MPGRVGLLTCISFAHFRYRPVLPFSAGAVVSEISLQIAYNYSLSVLASPHKCSVKSTTPLRKQRERPPTRMLFLVISYPQLTSSPLTPSYWSLNVQILVTPGEICSSLANSSLLNLSCSSLPWTLSTFSPLLILRWLAIRSRVGKGSLPLTGRFCSPSRRHHGCLHQCPASRRARACGCRLRST